MLMLDLTHPDFICNLISRKNPYFPQETGVFYTEILEMVIVWEL